MKIAVLTGSFLPKIGGAQIFSYSVSRQLAAMGHEVNVYVPIESYRALGPQYRSLLRPLPWKFHGLTRRVPLVGLAFAQLYLRQVQRENGYVGWLVVGTYPAGYEATGLEGMVPLVLRASGEDIQKSPELGYGQRLIRSVEARIRRAVVCYDRVVAMTDSARADLVELGVADEKIVPIPNGVDFDWFAHDGTVAEARRELGWPTDIPILLTSGRNHPKKGFHLIPAIADRLRQQGRRFRWYVVGLGTDRLDDEIRAGGLGDYVVTLGQVGLDENPAEARLPSKRLVRMYQAADIYAFPTLLENFAMVQLEAMAAGAVFVSTDAPGCRDLVKHNENGLQASAGDVDDFAYQLGRALDDPDLRYTLARNAREFAKACSWSSVASQYEELFRSLTGQSDPDVAHSAASKR